jgi:amino acid adenylation domain-containing protein
LRHYDSSPERFLLLSSFAFDSSVAGIFWTLCTGGTLVLPTHRLEQDVAALSDLIATERVTHTLCLPALHAQVLEHAEPARLATLRTVIVAGEACPVTLAHRHHAVLPAAQLHNEYGPTEATVWCTVHDVTTDPESARVPIGRPIAGAYLRVLDAGGLPAPVGVPGELYVGGEGVTQGYLNRPEDTHTRFVDDPFRPDGRLYRTGDRVRWLRNGTLEFLGRVDRQIKLRGYRIEPGEIEATLREHAAIRDAVVVLRDGASTGTDIDGLVAALATLEPDRVERLLHDVEHSSEGEPAP